jgi:beta-phosphoglucomutase-like phosphatase (HAD superfamily)
VGKSKEFPDVFIAAQKAIGTELEQTWVFEDSLVALKTASKAGFKTVGIYDKFNFGHDEMKRTVDIYIDENQTLMDLVYDAHP